MTVILPPANANWSIPDQALQFKCLTPLAELTGMQEHFTFTYVDTPPIDWSLDEHTCSVGRQGIAAARAILETNTSMASAA